MSTNKTSKPPVWPAGHNPDGTLKPARKPARDPMIIQMEKAYRSSRQYELDKLLRKQSLYRRRLTLAQTGLDNVQREIYDYLHGLAESRLSERGEASGCVSTSCGKACRSRLNTMPGTLRAGPPMPASRKPGTSRTCETRPRRRGLLAIRLATTTRKGGEHEQKPSSKTSSDMR